MATATSAFEPQVKVSANKLLINNKWVNSVSGKTFPTINPSTGEVIAQCGGRCGRRGYCGRSGAGSV